jgi:hypothetical protein
MALRCFASDLIYKDGCSNSLRDIMKEQCLNALMTLPYVCLIQSVTQALMIKNRIIRETSNITEFAADNTDDEPVELDTNMSAPPCGQATAPPPYVPTTQQKMPPTTTIVHENKKFR